MADSTPKSYSTDPSLYLYTSLSSGSSQIVTATARLETILKANRITFKALDVATDEKARMLWGRRAGKRKLPGLVRMGMVLGDLDEVEEWNEYGEVKEQLGSFAPAPATSTVPSTSNTPSKPQPAKVPVVSTPGSSVEASKTINLPAESSKQQNPGETASKSSAGGAGAPFVDAMRQAGLEAAEKAKQNKSKPVSSSTVALSGTSHIPTAAAVAVPSELGSTTSMLGPKQLDAERSELAPGLGPPRKVSETSPPTTVEDKPSNPRVDAAGAESPIPTTSSVSADTLAPSTAEVRSTITEEQIPIPAGAESTKHRGSSISAASKEVIQEVEHATRIEENPEEEEALEEEGNMAEGRTRQKEGEDEDPRSGTAGAEAEDGDAKIKEVAQNDDAETVNKGSDSGEVNLDDSGLKKESLEVGSEKTAAQKELDVVPEVQKSVEATDSDVLQDMPGTKTQDQDAADSEKVGKSVAD